MFLVLVPFICVFTISCSDDEDGGDDGGDEMTMTQPSLATTLSAIDLEEDTNKNLIKELTWNLTNGETSSCEELRYTNEW